MQARKLKALLNNTGYTVAFYDEYIGIGSPLCHDLIKLDIATRKITYALDTWRKGREALEQKSELLFIWDKLHELEASGEMDEIINNNDVIDNPLPVYTVKDGKLLSTTTDAYGWPNTTVVGYMMYDNTYFKTISEALEYGIKEYEASVFHLTERVSELRSEADRLELKMKDCINIITGLKLLTPSQKGDVLNTMNNQFDPNEQKQQEEATNDVQTIEQNAQEDALESSEEGSTEG